MSRTADGNEDVRVCVRAWVPFGLLKQLTDIHETWYERFAIQHCPNTVPCQGLNY